MGIGPRVVTAAVLMVLWATTLGSVAASADVQLLSHASDGAVGNAASNYPTISADGSRVAFGSTATNLEAVFGLPVDNNVLLWRGAANTLELVSMSAQVPSISGDGREVAFFSGLADVVPTVPAGHSLLRYVDSSATTLIDHKFESIDAPTDAPGSSPRVSGDGYWGVVVSSSSQMSEFPADSGSDTIYRAGVGSTLGPSLVGVNRIVNHAYNATHADNSANSQKSLGISADGQRVVWLSRATNLLATPATALYNVYAWDATSNMVQLVSRMSGADGAPADASSQAPAISADGRYVSFESTAANLNPSPDLVPDADMPGSFIAVSQGTEVYVRDLQTQTTTLVSRADGVDGAPANGSSVGFSATNEGEISTSISNDGRYVAFANTATNLSSEDCTPAQFFPVRYADIYVRDRVLNTTKLVSRAGHPDVADCQNTTGVHGNSGYPQLSADGKKVAFLAEASNLTALDAPLDTIAQVYVADTNVDTSVPAPPANPAPAIPAGTPTPKDTTAPTLDTLKVDPSVFADLKAHGASAAKPRKKKPHRGATISFRISEAATVRLDVLTRPAGSASSAKKRKKRRRVAPRRLGSLKRTATSGRNHLPFSGIVAGHPLPPGRYTLKATAADAGGNASRVASTTFTVVAGT